MAEAKKIGEVIKEVDDAIIYKVVGEIAYVGKGKNVKGYGDKDEFRQGIAIKDETGNIWINIKDHHEIPLADKGKIITIEAFHSDTHGWIGCKKGSYVEKDKDNKDVTKHTLEVTKTGKITVGTGEAKKEETPKETTKENAPPKETPKPADTKQTNSSESVAKTTETKEDRIRSMDRTIDVLIGKRIDTDDIISFANAIMYYVCGDEAKAIEEMKKVSGNIKFEEGEK